MKVAIIGLGHMGMGMARNLVKAGHAVTAFDLSKPAMQAAAKAGMATAASGSAAVADVEARPGAARQRKLPPAGTAEISLCRPTRRKP